MGRKIFISYKYSDDNVLQLNYLDGVYRKKDTVRSYVDILQKYLEEKTDHIYKGESDNEDLSYLSESVIQDKLFDRIYDSTLTIVMISKGMKDSYKNQKEQWIPREVSYSLRNQSRKNSSGKTIYSSANAILGIVLPDANGRYSYFMNTCDTCNMSCTMYETNWLFKILRDNTFNRKSVDKENCVTNGNTLYHGHSSYITYVKWDDFYGNEKIYIDAAYEIRDDIDNYNIHVNLD